MSEETQNTTGQEPITLDPDSFKDLVLPAETDIAVYASETRSVATKNGTKLVSRFVVQDEQPNPEVKELAGEAVEFWFGTSGRPEERKLYRKLLFAKFGGIPAQFTPSDIDGTPFIIRVRHGKPDADGDVRMFLESIRAEG